MSSLLFKTVLYPLFRRFTRTFLAILMIGMSLWGLMLMLGLYGGMIYQMINNAVRSDSGELSLYAKGYRQDQKLSQHITNERAIIDTLSKESHVKSVVGRVLSEGMLATAQYSYGVQAMGIDLANEKQHAKLDAYMRDGNYTFLHKQNGAIIGSGLAKKLKVDIGSKVILSAQNSSGEINSIALRVSGIIQTNNGQIDNSAVYLDKEKARTFLGVKGVMQIALRYDDVKTLQTFQQSLQKAHPTLEVFRWDELYPALKQTESIMEQYSMISYLLIFIVAGIGIFGVLLVSVLERLREFAILQAIGTPFSDIAKMVLIESFAIGLLGYLLGVVLGGGTLVYFHLYGLDLSSFSDALSTFGMDAITYAVIKSSYFTTGALAVVIASFLSTLYPLYMLKKTKPIEVIHG